MTDFYLPRREREPFSFEPYIDRPGDNEVEARNCRNCGAPVDGAACSYCTTAHQPHGQLVEVTTFEDVAPRFVRRDA